MICTPYKKLMIPQKQKNPNWEKAITWLKGDLWKDIPIGKTEIAGAGLYATRSSYMSKKQNECLYESHQLYADIHMVIKGKELFNVCLRDGLKIVEPYSTEKDCDLLEGESLVVHQIVLCFPMAVIVFPWDVHMPAVALDDKPGEVEKIVIKVAL